MADDDLWKLKEDGYLNVDTDSKSIIYHPHLNIIFVVTRSSEVIVLDVNSGLILHKSSLSAKPGGNLYGTYLSGHDKILFTDGWGLGVRRDYNGVMLLDSILQTPLLKPDDTVKLELLLSEAILLQQSLRCIELPGIDQTAEVLQELGKKIKEGQSKPKKGTKAQKWNSICLELSHCSLKLVCAGMVQELKRQNRHIPALSIASAVNERLNCLLVPPAMAVEGPAAADRALMFSEAARRDTFVKWPHMNYKWALPDQMAQAGFYHQPNSTGDDRAMCFTCNVCLVCWEPTDEPWSEHERHSPSCPFVKGEYTQNVPLSVTYATAPAVTVAESQDEKVVCISTSSVPELVATATHHGLVTIWNIARQLKKEVVFFVSLSEPVVMWCCAEVLGCSDIMKCKESWPEKSKENVGRIDIEASSSDMAVDNLFTLPLGCEDLDLEITALSVVGSPQQRRGCEHPGGRRQAKAATGKGSRLRPSFIAGVSVGSRSPQDHGTAWGGSCCSSLVRAMNDVNEASNRETAALDIMKVQDTAELSRDSVLVSRAHGRCPFLVVYDFHHYGDADEQVADGSVDDEGGGGGIASRGVAGGGSSKKVVSGTGTSASSGTRQDGMYQEIFLSNFLIDVPGVDDVDADVVMAPPPDCLEGVEFFSGPAPPTAVVYSPVVPSSSSQVPSGSNGVGACDSSMLDVTFTNVDVNDLSKYPSTSEGNPSPVIIKVRSLAKKGSDSNVGGTDDQSEEPVIEMRREPVAIQCLPLPQQLRAAMNLTIIAIHPTLDGGHLLVVVSITALPELVTSSADNDTGMEVDVEVSADSTGLGLPRAGSSSSISGCRRECKMAGALLIYSLDLDGGEDEAVRVDEEPVLIRLLGELGECPIEVNMLPLAERDDDLHLGDPASPVKGMPHGLAAFVCRDGAVRVVNVATLRTVAVAAPEKRGARFISAVYCNSLERLCVCTDKGSLHFFVMNDEGFVEECEEEHVESSTLIKTPTTSAAAKFRVAETNSSSAGIPDFTEAIRASSPTGLGSASSNGTQLLANCSELGISELRQLYELTLFENLTPCYAATVPPCWSEMMQAQKQRRHPQHLQQGDDLQHTRTWRLQNDSTTWDEHVFEITLPRSCCIGHIDVKFFLHSPCSYPPNIQITLLKQNATGIGRKEKITIPQVDEGIDFNINMQCEGVLKGKIENPVTSEEYMRDHNCEVLCGPVNLAQCLDLSDVGGTVTLTSPKLFRVRGRTLLVHIKAVSTEKDVKDSTSKGRVSDDKGSASKKSRLDGGSKGKSSEDPVMDFYVQVPRNTVDRLVTAVASKKMDYYLGCDWLHEISITIRKTKQTNIPNERSQRCAMLESNQFVINLLNVVFLESQDKTRISQGLALDILAWVASIRLARNRSARGGADSCAQQLELIHIIERHLGRLILNCMLLSGRSIARKCVKLIIICSEGVKNTSDSASTKFDTIVLQALTEWLPLVSCCQSAGAMRWFLLLLTRVLPLDESGTAAQQCVLLLQQVAQEMSTRTNPFHLLLRTRFGLYGTPFEPELFDTEPPTPAKFSSVPITYATVVSGDMGGAGAGTAVGGGGTGSGGAAVGTTTSASSPASLASTMYSDVLDLRELLATSVGTCGIADLKSVPSRLKGLSSNHYMKGLLEVEPLHFVCHAASDGTKMEKNEQGSSLNAANVSVGNAVSFFDAANFILSYTGNKKADNDFISFYEDMKKDDSFYQTIPSDVKLTDTQNKLGIMFYALDKELAKVKTKTKSFSVVGSVGPSSSCITEASSSSSLTSSAFSGPAFQGMRKEISAGNKQDIKKGEEFSRISMPWQQLLTAPPQQTLLIERMHSGARRFVVLDFGSPILLTDLMVPACSDLVSLSIDIWCHGEESDGQRLVVASDIGNKALIMSDLQPPPICRFLKITTIGRYGMSTTRCKIPIGSFYGHIFVLPGENYPENSEVKELSTESIQAHLRMLSALFEDIHCRYSLSCAKLQEFLTPLLTSEIPNVVHMHHYLQKGREIEKLFPSQEGQKIISSYQECVTFQQQLNLVRNVIGRLELAQGKHISLPGTRDTQKLLTECCTNKLRVLGEGLLDIMLYLVYEIGPVPRIPVSLYNTFDQRVCERLFHWLCVREDTRIQLSACTLLVRMCGMQPWWGDFLASTLSRLYCSQNASIFPQDRVFILLTYLGRKSLAGGASRSSVLDSILTMLTRLLSPLASSQYSSSGFLRAEMDLSQIGWVLLFLSVCLDANCNSGSMNNSSSNHDDSSDKGKEKETAAPSRWDFIQGEMAMQRKMASSARSNASRSYRRKLQKRLMHHKQQLEDLEAAKKAFHASTQALSVLSSQAANLSSKLEAALKQQEQFFKKTLKQHSAKHFKDILQIRRTDGPILIGGKQSGAWSSGSSVGGRNGTGAGGASGSSRGTEDDLPVPDPRDPTLLLPQDRCLPVARGLVTLVLSMDFTCNIDMFLLACKVIARIVAIARPAISLSELVTQEQLLHFIRLAVWNDQHKASWGGPWASHAISCLLQDILEGTRLFREPEAEILLSDHDTTPSPSQPDPSTSTSSQQEVEFSSDDSPDTGVAGPSTSKGTGNSFQLPSLLESDDSELEGFLDDILERGRNLAKRSSSAAAARVGNNTPTTISHSSFPAMPLTSAALDARLELGVAASAEVILRQLTAQSAHNLVLSVVAPVTALPESARQSCIHAPSSEQAHTPWQQPATLSEDHGLEGSLAMLSRCFDIIFSELQTQNSWVNMELVLQLWLMLNSDCAFEPVSGAPGAFDPSAAPSVRVTPRAVSGLISALTHQPGISLRLWCLGFQSLTLMANQSQPQQENVWPMGLSDVDISLRAMAGAIVEDTQFMPMLLRFLSGSGLSYRTVSDKATQAGPFVCVAMKEFLVRLQGRCDVITCTSQLGNMLKELLLRLVYQLVQPTGALANQQGPLDAQCQLIDLVLNLNFTSVDISTAISTIECVAVQVYSYILSTEKVRCRSVSEPAAGNNDASSCFGGLFASVLGGEVKQSKPATWDALLCNLLKLSNRLVQIQLGSLQVSRSSEELMDTCESQQPESQTDEHKVAEQQSQQNSGSRHEVKVACVADTVLQHRGTMLRLLSSLAGCSGSTLAMLLGSAAASPSSTGASSERLSATALGEFGEPLSVGDAVFQLLVTLARKASSPSLILQPLFDFLSSCNSQPRVGTVGVMQLSEPLLWFILRVLDSEEALYEFNGMGGVKVICENLVKSNQALINSHPSMVSVVMQHFSHMPSASSSSSSSSKKQPNPIESYEGLLNFAPLGNISAGNLTAQPADVLIQSAPPHRRARTPAWSYHFYPDERWVELTLTLPCAVLLREVQLQPHLSSLATCPSAVAIEVCRDCSVGLVPVCPPVPTSGLTFIRLHLPQPEIVTSVLLRLYKPRDSSNIGLSQIRLLGSTTFGETAFRTINMDVPDEEQLTKSSLGWLRLLHHCLCVPIPGSALAHDIAASASEVPGLPEACCGLLLVPAPAPSFFTPSLERVLLRLGLHSRQLGLKQINTLLRNGAAAFLQGALPIAQSTTSNSAVVDSVVELLYQLCTTQDNATEDRVWALLSWLRETASSAIQVQEQSFSATEIWSPSSAYVHSAAAILWAGHINGVNYDLPSMVTPELFGVLYKWTLTLPSHSALKKAIDTLLCAMCFIRPSLFPTLLQKMGILVTNLATHQNASISDDRKDCNLDELHASITDDSKQQAMDGEQAGEWYGHLTTQEVNRMQLSEGQLMTLAMASQSPPGVQQLLDSGLPKLLGHAILDFANKGPHFIGSSDENIYVSSGSASQSRMTDADKANDRTGRNHTIGFSKDGIPMLHVETIAMILSFFAEVCSEGKMRDWLGSSEGSIFWLPLLRLLCTKSSNLESSDSVTTDRCELRSESYSALESATVKFLSRCCWCHPSNQQLLSRVLCNVIREQKVVKDMSFLHGISGFTRRLILQLLLENEKVFVFVKSDCPLQRGGLAMSSSTPYHPQYGVGHQQQLLFLSTQTTCGEILRNVTVSGSLLPLIGETKASDTRGSPTPVSSSFTGSKKELWELGIYMVDQLSVQAGVSAKDKRTKDAKNSAAAAASRSVSGKKSLSSAVQDTSMGTLQTASVTSSLQPQQFLEHSLCPGIPLPVQLQVSQLLSLILERGGSLSTPCLTINLFHPSRTVSGASKIPKENSAEAEAEKLLQLQGLETPLQVFTQMGGLALLAQHLPLVYPDTLRYTTPDKILSTTPDQVDAEWVKVDASDDIYEDLDETMPGSSSSPGGGVSRSVPLPPPSVPPHSLAAFGLFLRLPGYAEVLLRDKKKAQCLLRLALGVTDDGEGGDIFTSPVANSLHTLPFQVLRQLFDLTPLTTDDGVLLRRTTIEIGAVHLLLGCLAVFTHQSQDINLPGVQHELVIAATKASAAGNDSVGRGIKSDDKSHLYWAKGTGFGTGSTAQSWNVEQALLRQRSEEEHVTVLLQVFSSYISPCGQLPVSVVHEDDDGDDDSDNGSTQEQPLLPPTFHDLLKQSCLLPAVSSYLRNDSVLDMARHIPLYRAVLQLLRAMALSPQLVSLLLPQDHRQHNDELSVVCLLTKMRNCVDTYASRLKLNKSKGNGKSRTNTKLQEETEQDEGLALLIPDIQETANIVQMATERLVFESEHDTSVLRDGSCLSGIDLPLRRSLEERYLEVMRKLQFDTYEMITECSEGGYQFVVSYHFESNVRSAGERSHPARMKRLAQETVTLSTSLPLSYSSSVFVRCDTDRLDIMKVLITGPAETPYANGCFEFDVYFPPDYPNSPMLINLETTGHHTIRFNPNLYNDGKVCLSVLNTWHGRPEEKWNAQTSSFLQVLVSIQSLILVPEPYFNEPGYERSRGTPSGNHSSREYNSNICQATVKWAMLEQVRNPCPCFKQVIHTHFWMKRHEIVKQIENWILDMDSQCGDRRTGRAISLNSMALKRHFCQLKEELGKLRRPEGLEDLADSSFEFSPTSTSNIQSASGSKESSPMISSPKQEFLSFGGSSGSDEPPKPSVEDNLLSDVYKDMEMEKMVSQFCE